MRGVDLALQGLQPVAFALDEEQPALVLGQQRGFHHRQRRRLGARAHIGPDQPVALGHRIGLGADLVTELLMRRQVGHLEARAVGVVLPAVIDAAQPAVLVAAEEQRGGAVRAAVVEDSDAPLGVAERDQLLAQQHEAHRRAVGHELVRRRRRDPVLAHHLSHRRSRADAGQGLAVSYGRHGRTSLPGVTDGSND